MTTTHPPSAYRFYGRRSGKKMTPQRRQDLEKRLEHQGFPFWDPTESLEAWKHIHLEVGFGQGEHVIEMARRFPETLFIGSEVFQDGVLKVVEAACTLPLPNIRVVPHDARPLMAQLTPQSIHAFSLLFPDPWPKTRHWKRRMIHPDHLGLIGRILAPHSTVFLATDHDAYAQAMHETLVPEQGFHLKQALHMSPAEHDTDHIFTRYEQKALAKNKKCHYLTYTYFRDLGSNPEG